MFFYLPNILGMSPCHMCIVYLAINMSKYNNIVPARGFVN